MPGKLKETESFVEASQFGGSALPDRTTRLRSLRSPKVISGHRQRIDPDNTPLRDGDRMRLSIEAPWDGYLYVLNREQYADGSTSDPYLIFPAAGSGLAKTIRWPLGKGNRDSGPDRSGSIFQARQPKGR